ncbi:MAG: hypothetical protein K0R40_4390, partial [Burkholderiales bacterium]|nr:hypothetical protein [Burkholderiales bacterium]
NKIFSFIIVLSCEAASYRCKIATDRHMFFSHQEAFLSFLPL